MLDEEVIRFLHGGCGLVVATLDAEGFPFVSRAWGLTVLEPSEPLRVRLLMLPSVLAEGRVAVTGTDVPTLRSLQLKGRIVAVEPMTSDDFDKSQQYTDDFYSDIVAVDQFPLDMLNRVRPTEFQACIIEVDELFDQTPGPRAGRVVA